MATDRIAILGAGILGACLALLLARRGIEVTVFDKEPEPVACASRWNEGKIHLGYLYGADPSLRTARHILPGSLRFAPLLAELLASDLSAHTTPGDDFYLVHRDSVVDADRLAETFARVDALLAEAPGAAGYLTDVSDARTRRLSAAELAGLTSSDDIVAGFAVPERSISTRWVAERLAAALRAEPRIALRLGTWVTEVRRGDGGAWRVLADPGGDAPYDVVVNALWEGRLAIDRTAGLEPEPGWSHRYRLGLFVRTTHPVEAPSALLGIGPFGDVKNYNGRDFYASWYPAGLLAEGSGLTLAQPPELEPAARDRLIAETQQTLARLLPGTVPIFAAAETIDVKGGFVFVQGQGSLSDPAATIHRRDQFGIRRDGSYFSVDTGKYGSAPALAERLAALIGGE